MSSGNKRTIVWFDRGETEIKDFDVLMAINAEICRLEILVNDHVGLSCMDPKHALCDLKGPNETRCEREMKIR